MASGNFYGGVHSNHYRNYIYWSSTPNVAGLYSTVTVTMKFWCDWAISFSAPKNWDITCNGVKKSGTYTAGASGTGTWTVTTQTFTVNHSNGVAKSISISANFGMASTISGTYYGNISASGTANLGTITQVMPTAPTTVSTSAGTVAQTNTSFTISWSGAKNGTFNIAKYRLYYKNGTTYTYVKEIDVTDGTTSGSTSVTLANIVSTRGNSALFYVRAIDTKGNYSGYSSDNASVTLAKSPTAPTVSVSASTVAQTNTSFTLSWSGASAGSGSISKYRIYYKTSSSASWTTLKDVTGTSVSLTLSGIISTRGSSAYYTVATINSYGLVSSMGTTKTVTLANLPTAPTVTVSASTVAHTDTSFTLSWNGATAGSGSISKYRIYYKTSSSASWATLKDVTGTSATLTLSGIISTRGSTAYYTVGTINSYGLVSSGGTTTKTVTLANLPTAPTTVDVSATVVAHTDTSFTLSWSGAGAGSGSISKYRIYYRASTTASWATLKDVTGTSASLTLSGLVSTRGSSVYITVGTINSYGLVSATGGPPKQVWLANLPTAPTTISVSASTVAQTTTAFTLSWSGASAGSGSISKYRITYTIDGGATYPTLKDVTGTSASISLDGIVSTRGNSAKFFVHAINSFGLVSSTGGTGKSVTLAKLPTIPTSLTISNYEPKRNDSIDISWNGATAGSGTIKNYYVDVRRCKNNTWTDWKCVAYPTSTSHTLSIIETYADTSPNDILQIRIGVLNSYSLNSGTWKTSANITIKGGIAYTNVNRVVKEGIVYVKVNGVWKESASVYTNVNGVWKESI